MYKINLIKNSFSIAVEVKDADRGKRAHLDSQGVQMVVYVIPGTKTQQRPQCCPAKAKGELFSRHKKFIL